MSGSIDPLATLIAPVAAVILSAFCALLAWHQRRRLAAMQAQVDSLTAPFVTEKQITGVGSFAP